MMEPMTLGSAPTSPATPTTNPNFLPGFLIGDIAPSAPHNPTISPGRNKTPGSFKSPANINEHRNVRQGHQAWFNQSLVESPVPQSPNVQAQVKAGPPTTSLFDAVNKKSSTPVLCSTGAFQGDPSTFNESISRIHSEETFNSSRILNNSRLEKVDSHWITVFGFPPSALNVILSQLSNFGVIVEKKMPQGNWVQVRLSNLNEVARALSLNGKIINKNIMIGVQLHYPKENKENSGPVTSPVRARALRNSYIPPQHAPSPSNVIQGQNLPQKSTGLVSKAMEYMFGW